MRQPYTVFAVYEDDADQRYTALVIATSPAAAEKKAKKDAESPIIVAAVVLGTIIPVDGTARTNTTPLRGKHFETWVSQMHVSYVNIDVPLKCPGCKASLTAPNSIVQVDYWDHRWDGYVPKDAGVGEWGVTVNRDRGAYSPAELSGAAPAVALRCKACDHALWDGYMEATDADPQLPVKKVRR